MKQKIAHDQRLCRFLLAQVKETRQNFHEIWTDMELDYQDEDLEVVAKILEASEYSMSLALDKVEQIKPERKESTDD